MNFYTVKEMKQEFILSKYRPLIENKLFIKVPSASPRGYSFKFLNKEDLIAFRKVSGDSADTTVLFAFEDTVNIGLVDLGNMEVEI